ncbi:DNA-directed DNA polymerase [Tanacetum coccineum]
MNPNNNQEPPPTGPIPQNLALDLQTMEELCQPTMNGRGRPIAPINIQATNFGLLNHRIQQQNGVQHDVMCLCLFPYSLTHHATTWFDRLPKNSIHNWEEMVTKFLSKYFPPFMVTKLRNDISNFRQLPDESFFEAWERYKLSIDWCPNYNMLPVTQIDTFYNGLTLRYQDTINVAVGCTFMKRQPEECYDLIENMNAHHNDWETSAQRDESSRSITSSSPKINFHQTPNFPSTDEILRQHMIASDAKFQLLANQMTKIEKAFNERPQVPSPNPSSSKEVERDSETTMDQEKLLELANTPLNENCSAVLLNKLPKKLGHPGKFLVDKFTFLADFVVVDYDINPRVPLILGRLFLRTARALVDVHGEDLTLRVGDEKLTFNVVASISPSLTPFEDNDFLLEDIDAFLALDDSIPLEIDNGIYDSEKYILFLEKLLNDDPTKDFPPKELKNDEAKMNKSLIEEPPKLELKDSPPHLEYVLLEETSKLPVIITKDLKREEKDQLIKVLKSHKRAIAWKISNIRDIDPNFCTHKILMEDDFKPAVQHQRRVNPKIHEVIKGEVIKVLDAGLIYPISDSPWVSPVHVVPKKGGMTVVTNDNNELIPTRLVTGWRVCISKLLSIPKTKKKPPSPTLVGPLLTVGCISVFAMPRELFKDMMLKRCEDSDLVLNWEKCHFMVKEGIVLGHKISKNGIEVDRAKVDVIAKLPPPTMVKGKRSFLGHAGFYRRFIQDFSKIARPMTARDFCMRTRSQSRNLKRPQQQVPPAFVEPFNHEEPIENQDPPVVTMADNRTMVELLQAPTEGYEDAIVVPAITADNFELKHGLLTLVQNKHFLDMTKKTLMLTFDISTRSLLR